MNTTPEYDPENDEYDPAGGFSWLAVALGEDGLDDPEQDEDED